MDIGAKNHSQREIEEKAKKVEAIYEKMLAEAEEFEKKKKDIVENYVRKSERKKFF